MFRTQQCLHSQPSSDAFTDGRTVESTTEQFTVTRQLTQTDTVTHQRQFTHTDTMTHHSLLFI